MASRPTHDNARTAATFKWENGFNETGPDADRKTPEKRRARHSILLRLGSVTCKTVVGRTRRTTLAPRTSSCSYCTKIRYPSGLLGLLFAASPIVPSPRRTVPSCACWPEPYQVLPTQSSSQRLAGVVTSSGTQHTFFKYYGELTLHCHPLPPSTAHTATPPLPSSCPSPKHAQCRPRLPSSSSACPPPRR